LRDSRDLGVTDTLPAVHHLRRRAILNFGILHLSLYYRPVYRE